VRASYRADTPADVVAAARLGGGQRQSMVEHPLDRLGSTVCLGRFGDANAKPAAP